MIRVGAILLSLAVLLIGVLPADAGDVPLPVLSKAKGEKCVEPAEDMRRNHMLYLKHQREETMHEGIRSNKYSLKECVSCHATPDPKVGGKRTVRAFCKQCHEYAAVHIDCFHCHTPIAPGGSPKP